MKQVLLTLFLGILSSVGHAQTFSEIKSVASGSGELRIGEKVHRLTETNVNLNRDGSFVIVLKNRDRDFRFLGTWVKGAYTTANLKILSGDILQTGGQATVNLAGDWSLGSVSLYGTCKEGSFAGNFAAKNYSSGGHGGIGSVLDQTRTGIGTFRYSDSRGEEVRKARVFLQRNGVFEVTISGRNSFRFSGTWRYSNSNDAYLTVTNGPDGSVASGNGTLTGDFRGGFSAISINAKNKTRSFFLDFRADQPTGGSDMISSRIGVGSIRGYQNFDLKKGSVSLFKNGIFEIVVESDRKHIYQGRWRESDTQVDLYVTNVSGAGSLVRSGRTTYSRFAFVYTEDGKKYTVQFEAR